VSIAPADVTWAELQAIGELGRCRNCRALKVLHEPAAGDGGCVYWDCPRPPVPGARLEHWGPCRTFELEEP